MKHKKQKSVLAAPLVCPRCEKPMLTRKSLKHHPCAPKMKRPTPTA